MLWAWIEVTFSIALHQIINTILGLREDATPNEIEEMKKILLDALRVGYFGLSIDMLPFHRMLGSQYGGENSFFFSLK